MNVNPVNPSNDNFSDNPAEIASTGVPLNLQSAISLPPVPDSTPPESPEAELDPTPFMQQLFSEFPTELPARSPRVEAVVRRIVIEVARICRKSDRIQNSGDVQVEQMILARHRLQKCLNYYRAGSRQGRVELHSHLSTMVYRHIAPNQTQLGFSARYSAIEDFLQGFYIEVLKAFRRENQLPAEYSPKSQFELAEYMAFTEQYAKRRIALPGQRKQQLIVLRAQGYAQRQPPEAVLDLEQAVESAKGEEAEMMNRSPVVQQVREQMVSEAIDPSDAVIRDRVITELIAYLEEQGQSACVDYLVLKLKDLSAPEIDDLLGLSPRERDYLQQRFKYHVEKFSRSHRWQLVHQWLGADLDQNLGMTQQQWHLFLQKLVPEDRQLLQLKTGKLDDQEIAKILKCTLKQVQKRWVRLLDLAWQFRNNDPSQGDNLASG
ncbi:MAG: HetZ-related protein [Elainella sp. Prado103]|jgi:hypothetical protein|nr:HetZ-related protein [Elainella sp. Prado103]